MNLVKLLRKTAKENQEQQLREANEALDSVKSNLNMEDDKDFEMLKFFGTSNVITEQTKRVKSANNFIKGEFITRRDIRSVCMNYNLRFLNTSYYKKEIPLSALNDLRLFKEEKDLKKEDLDKKLFVIAPENHFQLGERPKSDPVILYEENGVYRIISKWGNDFSFIRSIQAFFYRSPNIIIVAGSIIILNSILTIGVVFLNWGGIIFLINMISVFLFLFFLIQEDDRITPLKDRWDSPYSN